MNYGEKSVEYLSIMAGNSRCPSLKSRVSAVQFRPCPPRRIESSSNITTALFLRSVRGLELVVGGSTPEEDRNSFPVHECLKY